MRSKLLVLCALLSACVATLDDPDPSLGGKGDGAGTCDDPHYGDGTCQVDLACGIPDVDCYVTFGSDSDAAQWAAARYPATTVPESDPVFIRARMLVDRAWDLYKANVPLGKLADKRLAAVVIEDPTLNAFAMADGAPGMVGLSIQMNRGLFTAMLTDDDIVGVLLHELTHIVRMHVIEEVANRTRRFYIATSPEQIGATAPEVPRAKEAGTAWRTTAGLAGIITDPAIGALPYDGNLGGLWANYQWTCSAPVATANLVTSRLMFDKLTFSFPIPADLKPQIDSALTALGTCGMIDPITLRARLDYLDPSWSAYLTPLLVGDESALLDRPFTEALLTLTSKRRAALRAIEADFTAATGAPWSALRFFSIEEEADDYATRISTHAHLPPGSGFNDLLVDLGPQRAACETAIAAGTAPYGTYLTDDHHSNCWRVMHAQQVAAAAETSAPPSTARTTPRGMWTPTRAEHPHPIY
jgi:hypothetical protein